MTHAIIFDCEYLTAPGAITRLWGGPFDPDPAVAQIGAVKLSLDTGFEILDEFQVLIASTDRFGKKVDLTPFFTELTGVDQATMDNDGETRGEALSRFERFAGEGTLWSWGKDELYLYGISCYLAGIKPALAASRFGNAIALAFNAGVPLEDLQKTSSGQLADYFGIKGEGRRHHDALDDAMSVALSLQFLLRNGKLQPADFQLPVKTKSR
ncbi:3'-5' exonuclease [Roseibium sp.]|uniref:3'-5' exonuclease n=1 Tax=Roseibium sp. TaxID=1936156 RepID=UPI003BB2046A